jgi:hypothetical protein
MATKKVELVPDPLKLTVEQIVHAVVRSLGERGLTKLIGAALAEYTDDDEFKRAQRKIANHA